MASTYRDVNIDLLHLRQALAQYLSDVLVPGEDPFKAPADSLKRKAAETLLYSAFAKQQGITADEKAAFFALQQQLNEQAITYSSSNSSPPANTDEPKPTRQASVIRDFELEVFIQNLLQNMHQQRVDLFNDHVSQVSNLIQPQPGAGANFALPAGVSPTVVATQLVTAARNVQAQNPTQFANFQASIPQLTSPTATPTQIQVAPVVKHEMEQWNKALQAETKQQGQQNAFNYMANHPFEARQSPSAQVYIIRNISVELLIMLMQKSMDAEAQKYMQKLILDDFMRQVAPRMQRSGMTSMTIEDITPVQHFQRVVENAHRAAPRAIMPAEATDYNTGLNSIPRATRTKVGA